MSLLLKPDGIDLKFYDFSKKLVSLRYMTKKTNKLSSILLMWAVFRTHLFLPEETVLLCSCNLSCFHILTFANLHYRVTEMLIDDIWSYLMSDNVTIVLCFVIFNLFCHFFYHSPLSVWIARGFAYQVKEYCFSGLSKI